jgi:hypothetical protein
VPLLVVEIEMDDEATLVVGVELEEPAKRIGPVELDDEATCVGPVERDVHVRLNVILKAEVIVTFEGDGSGGLKEK